MMKSPLVTPVQPMDQAELVCKISNCRFCDQIQQTPEGKIQVHCTKLSGSPHPIRVNLNTCLSCAEYHRG